MPKEERGSVAFVIHTGAEQPRVTGLQLSTIRSHASKIFQRRRRINRVHEHLRSVGWVHPEKENVDPSLPLRSASGFDLVCEGDVQHEVPTSSTSHCSHDHIRDHSMIRTNTLQSRIPSDGHRRDPFMSFPVEGDRDAHLAIDHCGPSLQSWWIRD